MVYKEKMSELMSKARYRKEEYIYPRMLPTFDRKTKEEYRKLDFSKPLIKDDEKFLVTEKFDGMNISFWVTDNGIEFKGRTTRTVGRLFPTLKNTQKDMITLFKERVKFGAFSKMFCELLPDGSIAPFEVWRGEELLLPSYGIKLEEVFTRVPFSAIKLNWKVMPYHAALKCAISGVKSVTDCPKPSFEKYKHSLELEPGIAEGLIIRPLSDLKKVFKLVTADLRRSSN